MQGATVDPLSSTLRLFLSADIVGSTAHKQRLSSETQPTQSGASPWFEPIAGFYRETERVFAREWKRFADKAVQRFDLEPGPAPEMWKGLGDEAIYMKVVTDHRQARWCIQCWIKTIHAVRVVFREKRLGLDVKASAWLAGFPINNSEIVFKSHLDADDNLLDDDDHIVMSYRRLIEFYNDPRSDSYTKDYIGPSMDTGFRLSAHSTVRKMMVSVDLALVMAVSMHPSDPDMPKVRFGYDGRRSLKGVLRDVPYPMFWLDLAASDDKLVSAEDAILRVSEVSASNVGEFAEEFIKSEPGLFEPYIDNRLETKFLKKPNDHDKKLVTLKSYVENELQKREAEQLSGSEPISAEEEASARKPEFVLVPGRM